jgi:starch phosphorylase
MNGVLNCSILDGWWCEGFDPALGWTIGGDDEGQDDETRDREDADSLYRVLTDEVTRCYYARNEHGLQTEWIGRMKLSIARLTPRFSTARMVREYAERFYLPAGRGELKVSPDVPAAEDHV